MLKKTTMTLSTILLAATISLTAHAQDQDLSENQTTPPSLTEEQKAQIEAEYKEMHEKFNALTDEQKAEIYDLYDAVNESKLEVIKKYVEFGLLSEDDAKKIENQMKNSAKLMREENQFIGIKVPKCHKDDTK